MTTFFVRVDKVARIEMDEFAAYAATYNETWAAKQFRRLASVLSQDLTKIRFQIGGSVVSTRLFRVGRETYWIIFTVDEATRTVDVLRFWNSKRDPSSLELGA